MIDTMPPKPTSTAIETKVYLQTFNNWQKWFTRLKELAKQKDM
jgi:hypothetical protein